MTVLALVAALLALVIAVATLVAVARWTRVLAALTTPTTHLPNRIKENQP